MPGLGAGIPLLGNRDTANTGGNPFAKVASIDEGVVFGQGTLAFNMRYAQSSSLGIGMHLADTEVIRPGRLINEVVRMQSSIAPNMKYSWTATEQIYLAQALTAASSKTLSEGIGVHPALQISIAVKVLQGLGIASTPLPSAIYTKTLAQGIGMHDAFRDFFGAGLADGFGVTETLAKQFRPQPSVSEGIGIASTLSNHFYIRVTMADHLGIDDVDALHMIYNGQLADGVEIVAGYVAPDGQFTTWAINTRTGATTEYSNYAFNSFARLGNVYVGANANGLYQLTGMDDDGADIIASIKSGFAEWGNGRFTMFKNAYLGVRGGGDYVLTLTTGDGKAYTYGVSARHMRSTKINIGKGIRTRYWAFELISTGQDFDLDTIEWVPLIPDRRV